LDTIYTRLIEEYVADCIIVDQNKDIIHINGNANQFLIIPKGNLQEVIIRYEPEAAINGVDIISKFADQVPLIQCVPNQIKLVFSNILKNGIEAMPESGNLFIKMKVDADESVIISFSDSGIGIPENEMDKLGDIFYTTKKEGLGLGLLISYKIIENHNGHISIKSTPNKGTLVEITLRSS
jgi:two-component system, chemotaxis family, CheB/CheR fusion protein